MILYHAVSSFQLIETVLLKKRFHPDEKGVLIISSDVVNRLKNYMDFLYFFDDIVEYSNGDGNRMIAAGSDVSVYFDRVLKDKGYNITDFEKIYLACAHHSFGVYVAQKNIPYIFVEDGVGALSRPEVLHTVEKERVVKDQLSMEYGLYDGSSPNAVSCIYNKYHQVEGFVHDKRYIHFDVYEQLSALSEKDRSYLLKIFTKLSSIPCDKHSVLLLTEHFANLQIFSWDEQILLYQLLVDYFFSDYSLVFKPHPDDLMYYEELFPGSYIIKDRFPAEILPFLFENKPEVVATVSSTAIYTLKSCFDKTMAFNYDFSHYKRQFKDLHRIYTALKIAEKASGEVVYTYAMNKIIADNLISAGRIKIKQAQALDSLDDFISAGDGGALIIDNCNYYSEDNESTICDFLDRLPDNKLVIFTNSAADYCFYNFDRKALLRYFSLVKVSRKFLRDDCLDTPDDEYVFCFSRSKMNIPKIQLELSYTGETISVQEVSGLEASVQMIICLMNGINSRLAECLALNEEYRSQLTADEEKRIPVFNPDYDSLSSGYSELNALEGTQEQNFRIVKGMLMASEKRYLYFLEENKYLKELIEKKAGN